jgi:hypothetical protein
MDPVTPEQITVLRQLVGALERNAIPYQATGGLAGNVHGSLWPLHDIDLDVPTAMLPQVADLFRDAVVWGPARYVDHEFDVELLRLELHGVPVDVCGTEDAFVLTPAGERLSLVTDLAAAQRLEFRGLSLNVLSLAELIAYKRLLGRSADVADLEQLAGK